MKEEVTVFSQRLAGFLMLHGYKLLRVEPRRKVPHLNMFIFEDSEGLRSMFAEYKKSR